MSEDYNSVLNVRAGASRTEYRAAYIALAKRWHPDKNGAPGAAAEFRRLALAYANSLQAPPGGDLANPSHGACAARVVRCLRCSTKVVFPRRTEFTGLVSFLLWSWRWRVSGVFCPRCAKWAALRTSAASLLLGWWSVQGIMITPIAIAVNLRGGRQDKSVTFKLSCHNLFALTAAGDLDAARALARFIVAQRQSLPVTVAHLVTSLTAATREGP